MKFTFNLPDGTTEDINLTASTATPVPANSFAIGTTPAATAANLNTALTTAVKALANGPLVAASAEQAGNDFFGQPPVRVGPADHVVRSITVVTGLPGQQQERRRGHRQHPPQRCGGYRLDRDEFLRW